MSTQFDMQRLRTANLILAEPRENDALFGEIVSRPADARLADRSRAIRRGFLRKRALLLAVAVLLLPAVAVGGIAGWSLFAPTKGQLEAERGGTLLPQSLRTLRSLELPGGTTWTVVTYETTKYECLDVYGAVTGSAEPAGAVGGCGSPPLTRDQAIQGGAGGSLMIGNDVYSVAGGRVASEVAAVRATFADGSSALDHPVGGVWLFVGSPERSPVLVEALDGHGEVLGSLRL